MKFRDITYNDIPSIIFPLYYLKDTQRIYNDSGLITLDEQLIDDRNMPAQTVGMRRLQSPFNDNLYNLKIIVKSPTQLISFNKGNTFITSTGVLVKYTRKLTARIKSYKIRKVELRDTFSILTLQNWQVPMKVSAPPEKDFLYATCACTKSGPIYVLGYTRREIKERVKRI